MSVRPLLSLQDMQRRKPDQRVPSPCISVCELDLERTRCKGCYRTLDELRAWGAMSDDEKLQVWGLIESRQRGATA
jgi:hypothetical protein